MYTGTTVAPGYPYTLVFFPLNTTASPLQGISAAPSFAPTKMPLRPTAQPSGMSLCGGVYNSMPNDTEWSFTFTYSSIPGESKSMFNCI